MDGYYDHHPTLALPRPVAITGFFCAGVSAVASTLSQRTGLALVELDRWIEHEAGCSLGELVFREGDAALRRTEARLLPRGLEQQPPALIALGDGALLDEENLAQIKAQADLVYLRADLSTLLPRIQDEVARAPGAMYPFLLGPPQELADLVPLFEAREPGYAEASHVIDVDTRSIMDVATQLRALLGSLGARDPGHRG